MSYIKFTKIYPTDARCVRNFVTGSGLILTLAMIRTGNPVSLLRSRLSRLVSDEIPGRFSSSLPPLFAPGRFATFLSFGG